MKLPAFLLALFAALTLFAAPPEVEQQAAQLRTILQQADKAYYEQHESIMADAAYDALRAQYAELASNYPDLEPYTFVGSDPNPAEHKMAHRAPVLSLEKAYTDEGLINFIARCRTNQLYRIEPKIDGLTVVLHYENDLLTQALTRGNGKAGSDVTAALLASGCIPAKLKAPVKNLYVRGEVFIPHTAFHALNERRILEGKNPLKSPRNTAAGTLRLKDYSEISNRGLQMSIFELLDADQIPETHTGAMLLVNEAGLPTVEGKTVKGPDVCKTVSQMNEQRTAYPFLTDGLVIKLDNRAAYEKMGATSHHPRGAIARKYKTIPVSTKLLRVEWSTGQTGKLTPIAHFEPIQFSGAAVESATLHNLNHLRALDLMIGDSIRVIRAGGAVPQIIAVETEKRTGKEITISDPE